MKQSSIPIKVAVTYRVCQHWRAPVFNRLHKDPRLELTVLHGQNVPRTKLVNGNAKYDFKRIAHFTIKRSGCSWVFHPFIWWSLVKLRPDVIIAEGASNLWTNFLIIAYARATRTPIAWWTLGELPFTTYNTFPRRLYRALVSFQEHQCSVWLGYSSAAMEYFNRRGFPVSNCFRAVNCVDTDTILSNIQNDRKQAIQLAKHLELEDTFVILFVGALTKGKSIERLLVAQAMIINSGRESRLVIVGDGTHRSSLERTCSDLGISDYVIFAGEVISGVGSYFELADVFVMPGLGGLAVSEALCHGVPVLCSYGDGCEIDYVQNDITGYRLVSDDDRIITDFLFEKLVALIDNSEKLKEMKYQAKMLIECKLNVNSYVEGIVDAIMHAANQTATK